LAESYALRDPRDAAREITVHVHRPAGFTPASPVLMVMHGRARNGLDYCRYFGPESERRGFLVVAPEFSDAHYPHPHAYNYGNMCGLDEAMLPRTQWLFPVLDAVFDDVRERTGSRRGTFCLFGHSAGGQLVHRLATFGWLARIERAIAANSGSYTLPTREERFPFGLGGAPLGDDELRAFFARPLTIQLGDADVNPDDEHLPREAAAMAQGPHRFARGHRYLEVARREAARLGVPLAWRLSVVPGVGHSGESMAPFAVREFGL
jgi:poly(3-hydroxybutyrate) depolymerase